MALRKLDGEDLNPDRGPVRYAPWAPAGATPKAPPPKPRTRPKKDQPIFVSASSNSSSNPKST
eukprot:5243819-Pyramimonas_sp.AAC.1